MGELGVIILTIVLMIVCLLAEGFFSGSEIGVVSVERNMACGEVKKLAANSHHKRLPRHEAHRQEAPNPTMA